MADQRLVFGSDLLKRRDWLLGDNQDVNGGFGLDVVKGEAQVVFIDNFRRDFLANNLRENRISHNIRALLL